MSGFLGLPHGLGGSPPPTRLEAFVSKCEQKAPIAAVILAPVTACVLTAAQKGLGQQIKQHLNLEDAPIIGTAAALVGRAGAGLLMAGAAAVFIWGLAPAFLLHERRERLAAQAKS